MGLDRRDTAGDGRISILSGLSAVWPSYLPNANTSQICEEKLMSTAPNAYGDLTSSVSKQLTKLRDDLPDVMQGFSDLARAASRDGVLDRKTKELIAMALGVAAHCDTCIGFHVQALVRLGTTKAELEEALGMAIYMGGGPSARYAANALAAFEEFSEAP
jgi:AhpD family alkylhydroperoxidase